VLLTDGTVNGDFLGFQFLNKYSTGEKLLSDIVYLYSKLNPEEHRLSPHSKDTRLIAVYSPAGGAGKTTIAASLSAVCSSMGMQVFYLNLESIQSTGVFFTAKSKRTLSYIFYYLKERSLNLPFRMQGIKSTDEANGVQYFNPPDSPLEYEELSADELELLLNGIRDMSIYSYVFIDMSSSFDSKNCKILELCDRIILINLEEHIAAHKCRRFLDELVKLDGSELGNISDKLITVINRYRGGSGEAYASVRIPEYSRAYLDSEDRIAIDDEGFRDSIKQLAGRLSGI
jgi:MinD-like ATPase involved in chromosome partitioning or flagellar assembly